MGDLVSFLPRGKDLSWRRLIAGLQRPLRRSAIIPDWVYHRERTWFEAPFACSHLKPGRKLCHRGQSDRAAHYHINHEHWLNHVGPITGAGQILTREGNMTWVGIFFHWLGSKDVLWSFCRTGSGSRFSSSLSRLSEEAAIDAVKAEALRPLAARRSSITLFLLSNCVISAGWKASTTAAETLITGRLPGAKGLSGRRSGFRA